MSRTNGSSSAARANQTTASRLGVVVVDPILTARAGTRLLVESQQDMEVLGEAAWADEGLQAVRRIRRRGRVAVLVSLGLTGEHDAFWLIREIRERCPHNVILAFGVSPARIAISRALFVGADGYLDSSTEPEEFLDGVRRALEGQVVAIDGNTYVVRDTNGVEHRVYADSATTGTRNIVAGDRVVIVKSTTPMAHAESIAKR